MPSTTAQQLYDQLHEVSAGTVCRYDLQTCESLAPLVNRIQVLKQKKNAVILAHTYVAPEILYGVADHKGDSYGLSKAASGSDCKCIIFSAVRFMAETAKILNPEKEVLLPASDPSCTLADSITGADVRSLRVEYPEHTFLCYINTTAEVKAECDICVTSSNVYDIVERVPSDKIVFLPDRLMGLNLQEEMKRRGVEKHIVLWQGTCTVHEEYDPETIDFLRLEVPGLEVVAHPECRPDVALKADFIGSTEQMLGHVAGSENQNFLMLTECGLSARLQSEHPEKHLIGSCSLCKYMRSNTLEGILRVLEDPRPEDRIELPAEMMNRARNCIERMFEYAEAPRSIAGDCS